MRANGSHLRQLTHNQADDLSPCFSPNGKTIVFESDRDDQVDFTTEIYKMRPTAGSSTG